MQPQELSRKTDVWEILQLWILLVFQHCHIVWFDNSLVDNDNLKQPDFKVCSQNYAVETLPKWWSVGHTDEWAYRTEEEEKLTK